MRWRCFKTQQDINRNIAQDTDFLASVRGDSGEVRRVARTVKCNGPAEPGQVKRLKRIPQPGASSSTLDAGVDSCKSESGHRSQRRA